MDSLGEVGFDSRAECFFSWLPARSWGPQATAVCVCVCVCVLSCVWLFVTPWTVAYRLPCPWKVPSKNTGVGCHFLLQGIFQIQGSNLHLLHWLAIFFYHCINWEAPRATTQFSSVTQSYLTLWNPMNCNRPGFPVHHQLPELPQTRLLCWWCRPTISSSVIPFSSCLQSFPASGSIPMSQFFTSTGQSIGVSISASVLPMNI